jgi:hypothetical protein
MEVTMPNDTPIWNYRAGTATGVTVNTRRNVARVDVCVCGDQLEVKHTHMVGCETRQVLMFIPLTMVHKLITEGENKELNNPTT